MTIDKFEAEISRLLGREGETGLIVDSLEISVAADGCLSAKFNGEAIHCEGKTWANSLDSIVQFIAKQKGGRT